MLTAVALEPEGVDTGEVTELVALEVELPELVAELVSEGCDEAPESVAADGNALGVKGPIEVPPVSELYVLTSRLAWEVVYGQVGTYVAALPILVSLSALTTVALDSAPTRAIIKVRYVCMVPVNAERKF